MSDTLAADVAAWLLARRQRDPITGLRQHGLSSDALAMYALGMPLIDSWGLPPEPHDPSDLAACYLTVMRAPERLRERMQPVLDEWRAKVAQRYPLDEMDARLAVLS